LAFSIPEILARCRVVSQNGYKTWSLGDFV